MPRITDTVRGSSVLETKVSCTEFPRMHKPISNYRDLIVWQRAMELVDVIDDIVMGLASYQRWWIGLQMHRAALSIASCIAEGHQSDFTGVYLTRLSDAKGSTTEVETQVLVIVRRRLAGEDKTSRALDLCDQIGRMLTSLTRPVRSSRRPSNRTMKGRSA
jgi:four helix bundle protein